MKLRNTLRRSEEAEEGQTRLGKEDNGDKEVRKRLGCVKEAGKGDRNGFFHSWGIVMVYYEVRIAATSYVGLHLFCKISRHNSPEA
jgi:hypothetical protein